MKNRTLSPVPLRNSTTKVLSLLKSGRRFSARECAYFCDSRRACLPGDVA